MTTPNQQLPRLLQWWVTPQLPSHYFFALPRPKTVVTIVRHYLVQLLVHPIKRRIAKYHVKFLQTVVRTQVIGITGSVGKTTTKEMIASVLSQKYRTVSSLGNIDPVYNIPTTILTATLRTQMLVLEMGVEYPGDMDFYLWMVKPAVGVLNNIYWTHTEFLGGVEGVAAEKSKLILSLPKNGWAVLCGDDRRVTALKSETHAQVVMYSFRPGGAKEEVRAQDVRITKELNTEFILHIAGESEKVQLPVLGEHFVYSALAAAAVGHTQQVPIIAIKRGLETFTPQPHRMVPVRTKSGALLLDDTYNSNPLGAKAALETLVQVGKGKKKIAVLGDMLELGTYTDKGHREVGKWAAQKGVNMLVCVGEYANFLAEGAHEGGMKKEDIVVFPTGLSALKALRPLLSRTSVVLFKASRKLGFERLFEILR